MHAGALRTSYAVDPAARFSESSVSVAANLAKIDFSNIFNGSISIDCRQRVETRVTCTQGCAPESDAASAESWELFGKKKREECQNAGCQMCAGICCQPSGCTSTQVVVFDCGGSGSSS
jgi:hypothetical protein